MRGGRAFERVLLRAAGRGQRVLHLSGHTHWTDLYELQTHRGDAFVRWDHAQFEAGPQTILGNAALINTQSATHSGVGRRRRKQKQRRGLSEDSKGTNVPRNKQGTSKPPSTER